MGNLLPQAAIDLLPFSNEAMSHWKEDTDIRVFAQSLYADDNMPDLGSERCTEFEKEMREQGRSFTKNLQEAQLGTSYIDFYQNGSFGQIVKYVIAFKCCVQSILEDAHFYSLAHLLESENEVECSLLLASNFYYKQATQMLRNLLEETFLPIHFCDNASDFDAWKANAYRVPPLRGRDGLVKRLHKKNIISEVLAIRISNLYEKLSAYIHGSENTLTHRNIHLGEIHGVEFRLESFSEWCQIFCECLDVCLHLLHINCIQWHAIHSLKVESLAKVGKTFCHTCHNEDEFDRWFLSPEHCHVTQDDLPLYTVDRSKLTEIAFYLYICRKCGNKITINASEFPYTKILCFREIDPPTDNPQTEKRLIEITEWAMLVRSSNDPFCEWYAVQTEGEDNITPLLAHLDGYLSQKDD